jgi:hypothetical protein
MQHDFAPHQFEASRLAEINQFGGLAREPGRAGLSALLISAITIH